MTKMEKIFNFLDISKKTWYNWKKEERAIVKFIEKYLTSDDIDEFIKTGKINKFELLPNIDNMLIEIEKKMEDKINQFSPDFSSVDFMMKMGMLINKMKDKEIEITQKSVLNYLRTCNERFLTDDDVVSYAAGISILEKHEFDLALLHGLF